MKLKSSLLILLIISLILFSISGLCVYVFGRTIDIRVDVQDSQNISIDYDESMLELISQSRNGNILDLDFRGLDKDGAALVTVSGNYTQGIYLYVHKFGIITANNFFGRCNGDIAFAISYILLLIISFAMLLKKYKKSMKESICRYSNITLLGFMVFIGFLLSILLIEIIYDVIIYQQKATSKNPTLLPTKKMI